MGCVVAGVAKNRHMSFEKVQNLFEDDLELIRNKIEKATGVEVCDLVHSNDLIIGKNQLKAWQVNKLTHFAKLAE
jgi:uncharacterized UPF0160 family protein